MDVNLNKSLEIFKQTESLKKGDIKNLKQKDRKIISIAMSVVSKSKGGCTAKDISNTDLMDFKTHVTEKAPKKEQKSGLLTRLNKFVKNFFFRRISSQALVSKMAKAEQQVGLLAKNEASIKQEKGEIQEKIKGLEKEIGEFKKGLELQNSKIHCTKDLLSFFNELSKIKDKDEGLKMVLGKIEEYTAKMEKADINPDLKSYLEQNIMQSLIVLKNKLKKKGLQGSSFFNELSNVTDRSKALSMIQKNLDQYTEDKLQNESSKQEKDILTKIKNEIVSKGLEDPSVKSKIEKQRSISIETLIKTMTTRNSEKLEKLEKDSTFSIKNIEKWNKELASSRNELKQLSNQESIIQSLKKREPSVIPPPEDTQKPPSTIEWE